MKPVKQNRKIKKPLVLTVGVKYVPAVSLAGETAQLMPRENR